MIERNVKHFISEIIADDIEKYIDSEISIEIDYIIHQRYKMKPETACNEMVQLRHVLLKQVDKFYYIDAITEFKKHSLEKYIKEKIAKSIFYIKKTIYESEVND